MATAKGDVSLDGGADQISTRHVARSSKIRSAFWHGDFRGGITIKRI